MRTAFAAHAVPPRPRMMASAAAVPRISSRRGRPRSRASARGGSGSGPTPAARTRSRRHADGAERRSDDDETGQEPVELGAEPGEGHEQGAGHVAEQRPAEAEGAEAQERDADQEHEQTPGFTSPPD